MITARAPVDPRPPVGTDMTRYLWRRRRPRRQRAIAPRFVPLDRGCLLKPTIDLPPNALARRPGSGPNGRQMYQFRGLSVARGPRDVHARRGGRL
ncbi:MAG: hypothetical protein AVDCRST_MAG03-2030 [uncultured Rubrobacteraceae bacterium]|uniref:Uncharacterized protein n=1 Tax=uncultured Rubrobacteraceae bacterium TaxID=349277 RepID=A0A6J4PEH6_9ACTN|nr:MAG: hypothetical protein AVDCRST_MAG03-2030 [uncultured Rubrobacteraceae bacterium]